jgi:hypothetical protein
MKTLGIAVAALTFAAVTPALAQSSAPAPLNPPPPTTIVVVDAADTVRTPVRAPSKAFELGVEGGFTQGFGSVTSDPRVGAGPGGTVGLSLGYRASPHWSLGVDGQYQAYGAADAINNAPGLRGVSTDVSGTYHLTPYDRVDPYVTLGTGYRLLVESPAGDAPATLTHGFELGKLEVGLDLRAAESVALSPVLGVDVNLFLLRAGGGLESASLGTGVVNTFVFAGLKGRFDVGGTRELRPAR